MDTPRDALVYLRVPDDFEPRLRALLEKSARREPLTPHEQIEADGLVELAELAAQLRAHVSVRPPPPDAEPEATWQTPPASVVTVTRAGKTM